MISLLIALARSKDNLTWNWVENSATSSFDIKFNGHSTTYKNYGWFVIFRIIYPTGPSKLIYASGANHGKAYYDGINLEIKPEIDQATNYLIVSFEITNNGTEPKRVEVGVFADVKIDENDKALIYILEGQRGFTMHDNNTNLKYTLLIRDAPGSTNVDTFYYGPILNNWVTRDDNDRFYYVTDNFPYFENATNQKEQVYDSCFAFSWKERDVYPGETLKLSTTAGVGSNLFTPPFVNIVDNFKEIYEPNHLLVVKFSVGDYNPKETVSYTFTDSLGITKSDKFTSSQTNKIKNYELNLNIGRGPEYWFTISAKDTHGLKSNVIHKSIFITKKPKLSITNNVNGTYKKGKKIYIEGTVFDDTKVTIKYIFDNRFVLIAKFIAMIKLNHFEQI